MKRCASLSVMIGVTVLLAIAGVHAQGGKFSVQFDNTPLSRVLDAFKRFDPNFQFALAPDLGQTGISASLVDVTVDEALQIVLAQAGLQSVKDAGVYQIRQKPEAKGPRADRPALRLPPPVFINRSVTPGGAPADGAAGAAPAAGSPAAAAAAAAQQERPPLRLILMRFEDPSLFGEPYGGAAGGGGGGYGGSSGGSSGGGYGGSSGGGTSGRSGGSSGRSSGGSSGRSSGGSSGGSSRGGSY
ncbi:MAG: STN domain-containing protein [Armatimonadota bacterium]